MSDYHKSCLGYASRNYSIRTTSSFRTVLEIEKEEWKPFRNALDKSERKEFGDIGTFLDCMLQLAPILYSWYHFILSLCRFCSIIHKELKECISVPSISKRNQAELSAISRCCLFVLMNILLFVSAVVINPILDGVEILQVKGIVNTTEIAVRKEKILLSMLFVFGTKMKHLDTNKKKNNSKATVAKVLSLATIILIVGATVVIAPYSIQSALALIIEPNAELRSPKAPTVVSGDNIYTAWWTNNTENGNEEVMFRASNDGGSTFTNKTNLSNTTGADSWRVDIAGEGDSVVVTWWETNQTSDVPVARVSTDGGATFGPMVMLTANGTVSGVEEEATEEEGEGEEEEATAAGVIEEAVGGATP